MKGDNQIESRELQILIRIMIVQVLRVDRDKTQIRASQTRQRSRKVRLGAFSSKRRKHPGLKRSFLSRETNCLRC